MTAMQVVPIKCNTAPGNLNMADHEENCKKHADELGAIMITYPSIYGVFEPDVRRACELVHEHGGLIGLTSPGAIGADFCHLNLRKFFIPHGGGGPGVQPICVKGFLNPFLPHHKDEFQILSAAFGSASILPISWMYIFAMGDNGLLNANYMLTRLKDHYPILHTNANGRCAHEFIRLQNYGFQSPTMSWPVPNTLMIEPTVSESKEERVRFVDAMLGIREEIREIEEGKQPREGNQVGAAHSREKAAYPLPYLEEKKFWPSVTRIDDKYGNVNLFCTRPPVEDTTSA
ncbi:pyridoxal phosphate-dependent transferase [Ilyonectria sp. MPI-CAGE-AT-0026]|nr:pyridoxal phosphate-dependent transferase [Ilyonectria sp. MPI-CAGE-AT-0026]